MAEKLMGDGGKGMGEKPYLIDAVVGNGRMLATLG